MDLEEKEPPIKVQKTAMFIKGDQLLHDHYKKRWNCLSTGCARVDSLLKGGVLTRGITEISGHSGCGKTQLCLQLAMTVQLPPSVRGLSAGAAFICTEDKFPSKRLYQMITNSPLAKQYPNIQFSNNIHIKHFNDTVDLLNCVENQLPELIKSHNIGLIVVDSVAAVFRADYTLAEAKQRAVDLRNFASRLHFLANRHNIAVVCVNQVSDIKRGEGSQTVPALGLAWANLVTCRLQMFLTHSARELHVIFAPHLPQSSCRYKITEAGVEGFH